MLEHEKESIKQQLANITSPLNLPQIRIRAKSIDNQMQKLREGKEKAELKLPIIDNKSRHSAEQEKVEKKKSKPQIIKSDFALDVEAKLKDVLKGMGENVPEDGYGSYDSDDFDFQFKVKKIKGNKAVREKKEYCQIEDFDTGNNLKIGKKKDQQNNLGQSRPKSSRDMSNDNQLIQMRNNSLIRKRPKSSRHQNIQSNQQIGLFTKMQFDQGNVMAKKQQDLQIEAKNIINMNPIKNNQYQEAKKQGLPKSPNENRLKKPKIPKPVPKNTSDQTQERKEINNNLNKINFSIKSNRNKSRSRQNSAVKNISSRPKIRGVSGTPKSTEKDQNINRVKLSPIKSTKKLDLGRDQKINENRSAFVGKVDQIQQRKQFRTQQLKQMKMELDNKIKKIQNQIESINPEGKGVEEIEERMQISVLNTRHLGNQDNLDKQLQRLEKLQNRGERILGDYLQHRIMLMDLNIHNGETEILEDVYLGEDKNENNNNI